MAPNPSARPARRHAAESAPRKAQLRVVGPAERARTVGAIGTGVAGFFFLVLFALAGLHAVVVQTQAELDEVNGDIAALEELRVNTLADRAWSESAVGVETTALAAGYVPAPGLVIITPVPPGQLTRPEGPDPFAGGAAG
jgi:hypothetical protein